MDYNITVEKLGKAAYDLICGAKEPPTVHSVFTNAINLKYQEDYIITILPQNHSCGTQTIILSEATFKILRSSRLQAGESFEMDLKEWAKEDYVIDLTIPDKLYLNNELSITNNIKCCLDEMKCSSNQDGLASCLFGRENIYTKLLSTKLSQIDLHIIEQDESKLSDKLCSILGLGPGLTPSGDDFIYGVLSVLFYYNRLSGKSSDWLSLAAARISNAARNLTTVISYNMLRSCINGEFSEYIKNLLIGILYGNNVEPLLKKVLQIGSSSGADIAAGILYCLKILMIKEE